MAKTWTMAALAALVAACGGGGGRVTKSFNYGAATAASGESLNAAGSTESGVTAAAQFQPSPGNSSAAAAGASLMVLPDSMEAALDATSLALRANALSAGSSEEQVAAAAAARIVSSTGGVVVTSGCWSATATSVTFSNCAVTVDDPTSTVGVTLNGSINRNGDEVKWDLTATLAFAGSTSTGSANVNAKVHYFGDLTLTATTLNGFAESDKSISVSANGQSATLAWTTSADFEHLTFTDSCITGGALELKRIWTQRSSAGSSGASFLQDKALKLTWQGCGTVLVQHSI
jgi:hypothetical protein